VSSLPPWAADNLTGRDLPFQLLDEWWRQARLPQYPVAARLRDIWLAMGGRGSGKTRLGAEWVNALVRGLPPFTSRKHGRIALVGETLGDVREVMVEGPSGIIANARGDERPRYEPSRRRLVWNSGMVAHAFSSEDPDSLRGPQFEAAWCDELAKWKNVEATFDMLQFGLRLGERPIQLITTTPRPLPLLKRLMADAELEKDALRGREPSSTHAEGERTVRVSGGRPAPARTGGRCA
jgi:phage terminase large subunit-like protein